MLRRDRASRGSPTAGAATPFPHEGDALRVREVQRLRRRSDDIGVLRRPPRTARNPALPRRPRRPGAESCPRVVRITVPRVTRRVNESSGSKSIISRVGSRGSPRTRSPITLRWISLVPAHDRVGACRQQSVESTALRPVASRPGRSTGDRGVGEPLARLAQNSSRCSTRRRSRRPARAGGACRALCSRNSSPSIHDCASRWRTNHRRRPPARALERRGHERSSCSTCSLPDERAPRSFASVVLATRQPPWSGPMRLVDRHDHVVEEHLVELVLAGDLAERAHSTPPRPSGSPASRCRGGVGAQDRCARARSPCRRTSRTTTTPSVR